MGRGHVQPALQRPDRRGSRLPACPDLAHDLRGRAPAGILDDDADVVAVEAAQPLRHLLQAQERVVGEVRAQPGRECLVPRKRGERQRPRAKWRRRHQGLDRLERPLDRIGIGDAEGRRPRILDRGGEPGDPFAPHRDRLDHGGRQTGREPLGVDRETARPRLVHHVEADDEGQARLGDFEREGQGPLQVLRVPHHDDGRRPSRQQDVACDALVLRERKQRGRPRRVADEAAAPADRHRALGHLDRGPRVVRHRHVLARQRAEERALSDVRVSDQHDAVGVGRGTHFHIVNFGRRRLLMHLHQGGAPTLPGRTADAEERAGPARGRARPC